MSKIITFSLTFPAYHPKAGQPTYFVEKLWNSFNVKALGETFLMDYSDEILLKLNKDKPYDLLRSFTDSLQVKDRELLGEKHHTIRAGNRFVAGEMFSPHVWSASPYKSKQITIAPDIEVKKVYPIEMYIRSSTGYTQLYIYGVKESSKHKVKYINGEIKKVEDYLFNGSVFHRDKTYQPFRNELSKNDGLTTSDFADWFLLNPKLEQGNFGVFDKRFIGQIICWNDEVNY